MTVNRASGRGRSPHPGPTPWYSITRRLPSGSGKSNVEDRALLRSPNSHVASSSRAAGGTSSRQETPARPPDGRSTSRHASSSAVNEDLVLAEPGRSRRRHAATSHPRSGRPPARRDRRTRSLRRTKRGHPALGRARASAIDEGSPERGRVEAVGALEARHRVPDERGERLIAPGKGGDRRDRPDHADLPLR